MKLDNSLTVYGLHHSEKGIESAYRRYELTSQLNTELPEPYLDAYLKSKSAMFSTDHFQPINHSIFRRFKRDVCTVIRDKDRQTAVDNL